MLEQLQSMTVVLHWTSVASRSIILRNNVSREEQNSVLRFPLVMTLLGSGCMFCYTAVK